MFTLRVICFVLPAASKVAADAAWSIAGNELIVKAVEI
jgi:hypothetical protein